MPRFTQLARVELRDADGELDGVSQRRQLRASFENLLQEQSGLSAEDRSFLMKHFEDALERQDLDAPVELDPESLRRDWAVAVDALVPEAVCATPAGRQRDSLAVGVRPETARIDPNGVAATVAAVEYLGADTLIDTRIADRPFTVRVSGRASASAGDTLCVGWDPSTAHWFDLSSNCRIDR